MLPFGLDCREAVDEVAAEARRVPGEVIEGGTILLCCGSGVTLAGLLVGLAAAPARIIGVSAGRSVAAIKACVQKYSNIPENLELHSAELPYSQTVLVQCPFPSHPNYDLKAWKFLLDNLDRLQEPILFWNIGA